MVGDRIERVKPWRIAARHGRATQAEITFLQQRCDVKTFDLACDLLGLVPRTEMAVNEYHDVRKVVVILCGVSNERRRERTSGNGIHQL